MGIGPRLRIAATCAATVTAVVAVGGCASGGGRPDATARLQIVAPTAGQVSGTDVNLKLRLVGGRLVALTTKAVRPNEGHIHVFVDNALVSMTKGSSFVGLPMGHTRFLQGRSIHWVIFILSRSS